MLLIIRQISFIYIVSKLHIKVKIVYNILKFNKLQKYCLPNVVTVWIRGTFI